MMVESDGFSSIRMYVYSCGCRWFEMKKNGRRRSVCRRHGRNSRLVAIYINCLRCGKWTKKKPCCGGQKYCAPCAREVQREAARRCYRERDMRRRSSAKKSGPGQTDAQTSSPPIDDGPPGGEELEPLGPDPARSLNTIRKENPFYYDRVFGHLNFYDRAGGVGSGEILNPDNGNA